MTIDQAIRQHGAQAVYDAAGRHMAGDTSHGLASVGLTARSMGDVWRTQSAAYAQLGDAARAIDYAKASATLSSIGK